MNATDRTLSRQTARGALFGAAAFSAYAVVEFFGSSMAFRLSRPYAIFPAWHWHLTMLVVAGYVWCGILAGLAVGLAVALVRPRDPSAAVIDSAVGLTLVTALILNLLTGPGLANGGGLQLALALVFLALLLLGLRSSTWRTRLGWLTNAWIISAVWLGSGLAYSFLRYGVAEQFGKRTDLAAIGLGAGLALLAAIALLTGRAAMRGPAREAWPVRAGLFSCSAAALLFAISGALAFGNPVVAGAESGTAASSSRPNLVIVVMDTVRGDHLGIEGYARDTSPHLKALARDSITYLNAFSASDITLTSHASLFTGMYPSWHGAYSQPPEATYGRELSPKYPTLAELLKRSGYENLGAAANLYLRADFGLERGFDEFRIPRPVPMLPDDNRYMLRYRLRRVLSYFADTAQFDRLYAFGDDIDRELFNALSRRARPSDPFFAFVNYMDAHFPYVPPSPFNARFPGKRSGFTQDDLEAEMEQIAHQGGQPEGYRAHCESQYDGGIAYEDEQIGRLVDWLKRHNAYDNTMIVVTSDHGESFGEKNRVGHANSPYQNLLHVGLLIKYPHAAHRGVEAQPVSLIDVAPTALAVLNVPAPGTMQGVSLASGAPSGRSLFAETFINPVMHSPDCPEGCVTKVVFEWPMKFIQNLTTGKPEFFDLQADPHELHNLFATEQDRAATIAAHLAAWSKDLPAQSVQVKRVAPGIQRGLEGNGYIQK